MDGAGKPIRRIYRRAITDELDRSSVELQFDLRDDLDVEWAGHPNWFFRLSDFAERLLDLYEREPEFLVPVSRRHEMLNVIRSGLTDISISRGFSTWGIPVPGDESQVIWVWLDALPAYMTGVGYPDAEAFWRFWPAAVPVLGKDNTRVQI